MINDRGYDEGDFGTPERDYRPGLDLELGFERLVHDVAVFPAAWSLGGFPNPFNPAVTVAWSQPVAVVVHLAVYDAIGQRVAVLHDRELTPGIYEVRWDGTDDAGRPLASGVYMALLSKDGLRQGVTRMTLLR